MVNKQWNPYTSKWKAALRKGLEIKVDEEDNILYLGASSGTTVGYVSKLTKGIVFSVENSSKMAIPLVRLAQSKKNICPVFSDARDVDYIKKAIFDRKINILFQDIPSVDQVEILSKIVALVDKDCRVFFSLKTQSISQKDSKKTAEEVDEKLKENFKIIKKIDLYPFQKKHYFYFLKKI